MGNADYLLKYFTDGTAESEMDVLGDVFISFQGISDFFPPDKYSPRIVIGRKGSGKSAFMRAADKFLREFGHDSILMTPRDFGQISMVEDLSVAQASATFRPIIFNSIMHVYSRQIKGLAIGASADIYKRAIKSGEKEKDPISKISDFFLSVASIVSQRQISFETEDYSDSIHFFKRVLLDHAKKTERLFYIFINDTDQITAMNSPGQLNRIWGFILAARDVCHDLPFSRITISLREEVWTRITTDSESQRDQTDHFILQSRTLVPNRSDIEKIIERRLQLAERDLSGASRSKNSYEVFFEGISPRMPGSDVLSSWEDLIVSRSRNRPRDAIQLVHLAAMRCKKANEERINENHFEMIMHEFSRQRVDLLAQELHFEAPSIRQIIMQLADIEDNKGAFKNTADNLITFLDKLPSVMSVEIRGRQMRVGDRHSTFAIWDLLYRYGIMNARVADNSMKDGYRFLEPRENPTLVSASQWNEMQKCIWEVHPAYRDFISDLRAERARQIGLPPTQRLRRRKSGSRRGR